MEGRISSAIRIKAGDPIVGRLCCVIAVRDVLMVAASNEIPVEAGREVTCAREHVAVLEDQEWRAK